MSDLPLPPGPGNRLPVVGHALKLFRDPPGFLMDCYERYGPIFHIYLGDKPCAFLIGPEGNRFILQSGFANLQWRPATKMLERYMGKALFVMDGEEHHFQRQLMQPAFHLSRFEGYIAVMERIFANRCAQWEAMGQINLFDETQRVTLEVATQCLIGVAVGSRFEEYKELFTDLIGPTQSELASLPIPLFSPHARAVRARNRLWPMLTEVVQRKRANPGPDLLSALATAVDADGQRLTDEQVVGQGLGLMFAGHETTTSMAGMALYVLSQRREIRERVREEAFQVLGDRPVTAADLQRLPYMFLFLKEVERVFPVTPFGLRGVVEEFTFGGCRVPAGWQAAYSAQVSHRLPDVFPNPEQFDPERFAPPREEHKRIPYSLVGFGGGPRICLGINFGTLEVAALVATVVRRWNLVIAANAIYPLSYMPTLHPKRDVWARVEAEPRRTRGRVTQCSSG